MNSDTNKKTGEVAFYHLTTDTLERMLPKLLEKTYGAGLKSLVLVDSSERMEILDTSLWTYTPLGFLPHGREGCGRDPLDHPVWLATERLPTYPADVLVVTQGELIQDVGSFQRCVHIYDGNTPEELIKAQQNFKYYQSQGHKVSLWKQTIQGTWEMQS